MVEFKVGIIGAGVIAGRIADTLNQVDGICPYAIGSRDIDKANAFGDEHNIEKRYGSYEELVNDPDVELVYVATPHAFHAEQAKLALNAGKPVLVEKSFTCDGASAEEVINLAREKKLFCGEAMWIRFLPMYKIVMDMIDKGMIGAVHSMTCTLGYDLREKERLNKPELGGGALLDLGVYAINLADLIFRQPPISIGTSVIKSEATGVDTQETIQLNYKGGASAYAFITMNFKPDNNARIYGTKGHIEIVNMNNPEEIRLFSKDNTPAAVVKVSDKQITGYEYEFLAARDAVIIGKTEFASMPLAETLWIMKFMDNLRNGWAKQGQGSTPTPPVQNA